MAYNTGSIPSAEGKKEYTWEIGNFLGVDFAHSPIDVDPRRSPFAKNIMKKDGILQKRYGYKREWYLPEQQLGLEEQRINGIYLYAKKVVGLDGNVSIRRTNVIHYGTKVATCNLVGESMTVIYSGMKDSRSSGMIFNDILYILDGQSYYQYDGTTFKEVEGFVPTTSIGRSPQGGGQYLYATNLLQTYRKNTFLSDGTSTIYQLSDSGLDNNKITVSVLGTGGEMIVSIPEKIDLSANEYGFVVDRTTGRVTFNKSPYSLGYNSIFIQAVDDRGVDCIWTGILYDNQTSFQLGEYLPLTSAYVTVNLGVAELNNDGYYTAMNEYTTTFNEGQLGTIINSCFTVNRNTGQILFATAPSVSPLDGWDNIEVKYSVTDSEYGNRIHGCDIMTTYGYNGAGDRIIVSGNEKLRNWDFISAIDDPTYFPATHYSIIGNESSAIMGYSRMADGTLAIHKGSDGTNPTIYYREGILLSDEQLFSVKDGICGKGAVSKACFSNIGSDPVYLTRNGVCAVVPVENSDVNTRSELNRSYFVNPKLTAETNLNEAVSIYHDGYYYLAVGNHVYIADAFQHSSTPELNEWQYEWYFFDNFHIRTWFVDNNKRLMFGDDHGNISYFNKKNPQSAYEYTDMRSKYGAEGNMDMLPVECQWCTPLSFLGSSVYMKNIKGVYVISNPNDRTSINMNIDYIEPYPHNVISEEDLRNFSFWDSNETDFPYNGEPNPEIIAVKQKAKKVKMIGFRFWSNTGKLTLTHFVCTYTYGGRIKR